MDPFLLNKVSFTIIDKKIVINKINSLCFVIKKESGIDVQKQFCMTLKTETYYFQMQKLNKMSYSPSDRHTFFTAQTVYAPLVMISYKWLHCIKQHHLCAQFNTHFWLLTSTLTMNFYCSAKNIDGNYFFHVLNPSLCKLWELWSTPDMSTLPTFMLLRHIFYGAKGSSTLFCLY